MYVTPCKSICQIDASTWVCIGCNRTKKEIDNWPNMTDDERMSIMKRLGYGKRISREERMRRYDRG
jgi:predicted Fe-S protein YdhL (DUF1289 family)